MRKILILFIFFFITFHIFAFVVPSNELTSKYGISYEDRQKSNYIERGGYSFSYLGNGTWDVKQISMAKSPTTTNSGGSGNYSGIMILGGIVLLVIIIIGKCVSNITTEVAKNSGMDDKTAKKVGTSAGVIAGTAAAIGAAVLLGKAGGVKSDKK